MNDDPLAEADLAILDTTFGDSERALVALAAAGADQPMLKAALENLSQEQIRNLLARAEAAAAARQQEPPAPDPTSIIELLREIRHMRRTLDQLNGEIRRQFGLPLRSARKRKERRNASPSADALRK